MLILFKSLIRPIVEYNCEIWNPYKIKDIVDIEKTQRAFTYRIAGTSGLNYWERLLQLKIFSLQRRREKMIILTIWKIKNNIIPNSNNLIFKETLRNKACRAVLPPLPRTSSGLLTRYKNSFAVMGPKLWNCLPPHLTNIPKLDQFKSLLNHFLWGLPDKPPLPGYSVENNNSLLNYKHLSKSLY